MRARKNNVLATVISTSAKLMKGFKAKPKAVEERAVEEVAAAHIEQVVVIQPVAVPEVVITEDQVEEIFSDPISLEFLDADPVITPQGSTYNSRSLRGLAMDPFNRNETLNFEEIFPNKLVADLTEYYNTPDADMKHVPALLICEETGNLFEAPVVANNGKTYESSWISNYLELNKKLPTGEEQKTALYPNRVVVDFMDALNKLGLQVVDLEAAKLRV